jgi:hypothetical protein
MSTVVVCSEGGRVKFDGLRKRTVVARSEAGVKEVACSGAGIKHGRWRWWHDGF